MIVFISGTVRELTETGVVILTAGGLGYQVSCPQATLAKLKQGKEAALHTRFIVREDAQMLYGFADTDSAQLFDLLTAVSGVGPKLGLALLSAMPVSALAQGLLDGDAKLLSSVSGVGKKTAERLILEVQSKVPEHLAAPARGSGKAAATTSTAARDAIDALLALGFREAQVRGVVSALLSSDPDLEADALIRKGLGQLR